MRVTARLFNGRHRICGSRTCVGLAAWRPWRRSVTLGDCVCGERSALTTLGTGMRNRWRPGDQTTPNHKVSTRALLPGAQASFAPANDLRQRPLGMHERAYSQPSLGRPSCAPALLDCPSLIVDWAAIPMTIPAHGRISIYGWPSGLSFSLALVALAGSQYRPRLQPTPQPGFHRHALRGQVAMTAKTTIGILT